MSIPDPKTWGQHVRRMKGTCEARLLPNLSKAQTLQIGLILILPGYAGFYHLNSKSMPFYVDLSQYAFHYAGAVLCEIKYGPIWPSVRRSPP